MDTQQRSELVFWFGLVENIEWGASDTTQTPTSFQNIKSGIVSEHATIPLHITQTHAHTLFYYKDTLGWSSVS